MKHCLQKETARKCETTELRPKGPSCSWDPSVSVGLKSSCCFSLNIKGLERQQLTLKRLERDRPRMETGFPRARPTAAAQGQVPHSRSKTAF